MRSDSFEVDEEFRFIGRTFTEYCRMFDLTPRELPDAVLDCPGGPSSFTAVASVLGVEATAVDPAYDLPADALAEECTGAVETTVEQLRQTRDLFEWEFYGNVATRGRYLRAAAERFLADRARCPNRYVAASLPHLPFETDAFDLALSGNLCFVYDDRLDIGFHVDALDELARVAGEVRVFPLHSLDGSQSASLGPTMDRLRDRGRTVTRRSVPYEFQPGATQMLVVDS